MNLAMAAYAYLELVRRGAKYLSYTLVLDDNWPSPNRREARRLRVRPLHGVPAKLPAMKTK